MRSRESTLSPFFVEIDDIVDLFDAGKTTTLRFADEFRVVTLLLSEEIDVQHDFRYDRTESEAEAAAAAAFCYRVSEQRREKRGFRNSETRNGINGWQKEKRM